MLLCGCDGDEDNSETKPPVVTSSTTVSTSTETQTTKNTTGKATTITTSQAATETTAKTTKNTAAEVTETEISRTQAATEEAHEDEAVVDFGEKVTNAPQVTTAAETTETQAIPNGGDLPDDGMVWTPLIPVD